MSAQLCLTVVTLWTVACQAPLPMEFSRQEYLSGLPFPPPWDLAKAGIEPECLLPPELAGGNFYHCDIWEAPAISVRLAKS